MTDQHDTPTETNAATPQTTGTTSAEAAPMDGNASTPSATSTPAASSADTDKTFLQSWG